MFSKTKKIAGIMLAAAMIVTAFAGCGEETGGETGGDSGSKTEATQPTVEAISVDEMLADAELALGPEGKDSPVTLKVWAPADALDVFQAQCDAFSKNFKDQGRDITIEVVQQGESDAAAILMSDPNAAADVFGFVSDNASKLYPGGYVAPVRTQYAKAIEESNLEGAISVAKSDDQLVAFPETGDNGYIVYYNKSLISEEEVKSLESIMKVCNEKDKKFIMNLSNGFYGCVIPLTAGGTYELDADGAQVLNYDKEETVKVAKAFADLLAKDDNHFADDDVNKILASNLRNGKALAGVCGTWKLAAVKDALGDNFACAKLPTIKVDGEDKDMISMYGYKLIGVNKNTKYPYTSQALAYYLSGEKCQQERMDKLGWGPSITSLVEGEQAQNDECLSAMYKQMEHSVPQIGLAGSFWDPTGAFGKYVLDEKGDLTEEGLGKAFDNMVTSITAQ
ncbi:MAG: extracellular solute-binding protein [Acutalibacteraceae bacterium]|nr:extracellular solute-binding protein [Acutalibacteraceae bacterium]